MSLSNILLYLFHFKSGSGEHVAKSRSNFRLPHLSLEWCNSVNFQDIFIKFGDLSSEMFGKEMDKVTAKSKMQGGRVWLNWHGMTQLYNRHCVQTWSSKLKYTLVTQSNSRLNTHLPHAHPISPKGPVTFQQERLGDNQIYPPHPNHFKSMHPTRHQSWSHHMKNTQSPQPPTDAAVFVSSWLTLLFYQHCSLDCL